MAYVNYPDKTLEQVYQLKPTQFFSDLDLTLQLVIHTLLKAQRAVQKR